jgi:hypothetical protein
MKNMSLMMILLFIVSLVTAGNVNAAPKKRLALDKCLNDTSIEIKTCIKSEISKITIDSCYGVINKVYSNTAKERLKEYCFFNISNFSNLNSCLSAAGQFYSAEFHDEGIFECYIQFADRVDNRTCFELSKKMKFSNKKNYLANHCENR